MSKELPTEFPPGAEFTAELITAILRELWRWRRMEVVPPLTMDFADGKEPPVLAAYEEQDWYFADSGDGFAAASAMAPSMGTVALMFPDADGNLEIDTDAELDALSPLEDEIPANVTCIVERYYGFWYVTGFRCVPGGMTP